uniref:DNA polymerase n=1 Tax=Albugo laibachii Nc14 TaxID=890382 RepID=F0X153_9STRA|nr:predicted protein putative [Albugo laibachii Nc14]|eukprot:CCA27509.1 predicted protein putative [Albugo laibachii Nc14]
MMTSFKRANQNTDIASEIGNTGDGKRMKTTDHTQNELLPVIDEPQPTKKSWHRSSLDKVDPKTSSIDFQWIDVDMYDRQPLQFRTETGSKVYAEKSNQLFPVIRVYGVNATGNSVVLHVHGFMPYFYAACPENFDYEKCGQVRQALNKTLESTMKSGPPPIIGLEVVRNLKSIYGFQFDFSMTVWKVYVSMPAFVPKVRSLLENGISLPGFRSYQTYESNVPFLLRFMIDKEIHGCNWLQAPKGMYSIRSANDKQSSCQLELDIACTDLKSHSPTGQWSKLAPFRVLSFDIECMGRKGHFPEAEHDPIIQIANIVQEQGSPALLFRNVFVLGTCKPIVGTSVMEFVREEDMLERWAAFVRLADPDIITGYNVDNFDIPYILNRGKSLKLSEFDQLGRLLSKSAFMEKKTFSSAQYGKSESIKTTIHGRCTFDLYPIMRRSFQLSSYSLNAVSSAFLGQQKEDVPYGIISDLQRGTDDDRHRLAVYCLKDASLPLQLLHNLSLLVNYIEMARVCGVPIDYLLERGQQIKVYSMLLRKCKGANLLVPTLQRSQNANSGDAGYEGATVIEPIKAYYTVPIATLDFASLYPSIMQAHNLCYSTLVAPNDVDKLNPLQYQTSPSGDVFVKADTRKGILPMIIEELLSARKQAKYDMSRATDPMEKAVQNGRQLALKISANSVYGFTGAVVGQLPCIPIASSITAYGRQFLFQTKEEVERQFCVANGYPADAQVIYGDTDSVMVKFGVETVAEAMPLAKEAASRVSSIFPSPILLEFEKVYFPYLLMNKKRYAGLLWTNADKYEKVDSKGLETVRRDNCLLVRRLVETCLDKILIQQNVAGAIEYTKSMISDLLQNRIDISLLVITKGLKKLVDQRDYKVKQAHTELAERMRKRDAGSAPVLGERIAYVIVNKGKTAPLYEKAEDPVYVLENDIPIDWEYYMKQQLQNPLERIFEPIIGLARVRSELLQGAHTRKRSQPNLKQNSGGMMDFAVKKSKCLGCKAPLETMAAICKSCRTHQSSILIRHLQSVQELEILFHRFWTQCQNCQGSLHQDVLCTSRDCPIFYKRIKVQKDLGESQHALERFQTIDW